MRWDAMTRTSEDRYGFVGQRLVAQVAHYENDGGFWAAFVQLDRVPGRYATRDAAERAAESALGTG